MSGLCQAPSMRIADQEPIAHVLPVREIAIDGGDDRDALRRRLARSSGSAAAVPRNCVVSECHYVLQNVDSLVG